jgi:hypothetical protein
MSKVISDISQSQTPSPEDPKLEIKRINKSIFPNENTEKKKSNLLNPKAPDMSTVNVNFIIFLI